ncbi:MAG: UDP-N-acetylmuramate:L-alanyl-gamma-D-glutamyl-meso-diaminopimelate ligase [Verrucomicrobiae bacterium]|nr:UDP-N-acetylmuramate:L-alanyl-gamma-D-glutamyl-meso-diaminopimelate ligase [Verrucomicrobiae bacterium]
MNFHFLGICGTAMAGTAVALRGLGHTITGSDANVYPPMSLFLEDQGISIRLGYAPENLPDSCDLLVVGNAISRGNPELEAALDRRLRYASLPEVLRQFLLQGRRNLVVTGTHGKTTTTSMLAWILESAERRPSWMIGGIPKNLERGALFREGDFTVLEGDEYDTAFFDKRSKFLHYLPEIVVINNLEFDHADIFENLDAIKLAFRRLVHVVPRNGLIVANGDDANVREVVAAAPCPVCFVGLSAENDAHLTNVRLDPEHASFALRQGAPHTAAGDGSTRFSLPLSGLFNVRNAAAAAVVARHVGVSDAKIRDALAAFQGVKRRQEIRATVRGVILVDDFGHHPTALRQTLEALRHRWPTARLWAFFEPRSNTTRRAIFQKELSEALALADGVFVSQVARLDQLPLENRLDPERVIHDLHAKGREAHYLPTAAEIARVAAARLRPGDVAVLFSNGSFDGLHERLAAALVDSR